MVAAEVAIVAALFGAAWHLLANRLDGGQATVIRAGPANLRPRTPDPVQGIVPGRAIGPGRAAASPRPPVALPGLATDPAFWQRQFRAIDADESAWQRAQWQILQSAMSAIRTYFQRVILPAVERAERSGSRSGSAVPSAHGPSAMVRGP
jgi:hypothetical protein